MLLQLRSILTVAEIALFHGQDVSLVLGQKLFCVDDRT